MRRIRGSRSRCGRRRPRRSGGRTGRDNPPPAPDAASAVCRPAPAGRARGLAAATSRSPPGSGTRLITVCCPGRQHAPRTRAAAGPGEHWGTAGRPVTHPPRTGSRRPATRRRCRQITVVDAVQVRPLQWRQGARVQQIDPRGVVVAEGQPRPVGAERDPVGLLTARRRNDTGGPDRAAQRAGVEPDLAVQGRGGQRAVGGEGGAVAVVAVGLVARGLRPAGLAGVNAQALAVDRARRPGVCRPARRRGGTRRSAGPRCAASAPRFRGRTDRSAPAGQCRSIASSRRRRSACRPG